MSLTSLNVESRPEWEARPQAAGLSEIPRITAVLIAANVLVFLVMLFRGVPFFDPKPSNLLSWGANFGPLTTSGQWWRLLTACFLHAGIIHIAMNMYILLQIGFLTEQMFGSTLFLLLYLASGICGNIAGLYLHPLTTSVGASGAIFGLYGGLFAFLLVRRAHINKEGARPVLTNAVIFLGYNLVYGLASPTTDLVAHLGGLVSGFAIGCPLAMLRGPVQQRRRSLGAALSFAFAALAAFALWKLPRNDPGAAEFFRLLGSGQRLSAGFAGNLVYTGTATQEEATALAEVLGETGYYKGAGAVALFQKAPSSSALFIPLKSRRSLPQLWDDPAFLGAFKYFGPQLASAAGGLPFQIRLLNDNGNLVKVLPIARTEVAVAGQDRVGYSGDSTRKDAISLAASLQVAGYFKSTGAVVLLSKHNGVPEVIFPLRDDQWNDPKLMPTMMLVGARAALSLGGPPLNVKLVNLALRQQKVFFVEVPKTKSGLPGHISARAPAHP